MTRTPIPNCPQPETPIRERAWADGQRQAEPKYSDAEINVLATECECGPSQAAVRYKTIAKVLRSLLAERAASRPSTPDKADEDAADYPECSGDPSSCPENEGHGCCKPNPPAQAAQGEASLGRCKACGRATRAVCDGLDGNGLGCTNAPPIDITAAQQADR